MKKVLLFCAAMALTISLNAQLAWDTEFKQADFNNALTVISKSENVSWNNGVFGALASLQVGKLSILTPYEDECVIALPQVGIAEKIYFSWQGASNGTITVSASADHNNWSQVFTTEGNTISLAKADSAQLATNTRYIKFAATGRTAAAISGIRVSELKRLSANTDEWPFGAAMVDDAPAIKNVTVTWTNIVASVTSTDPHFTASVETLGQKNLIDQTTTITLSYLHNEAGNHSGDIVISGEGRELRIAVSGSTSKYDQTLTWNQTLGEHLTTDQIALNAYTSSGLKVEYTSSNPTIAEVADGIVVIKRSGEVELTAQQPGNYKFNATEALTKSLVLTKADPLVSAAAEAITYGQAVSASQLTETVGQVAGSLSWQDVDPASILDAGEYTFSALFTPADTGIYNYATVLAYLTVNKAEQTIVWEEQDTNLQVGQQVASTAQLSSGLDVTYAYTECLLKIEDGMVHAENEGEVTVVAYHPGNHNYLPTTVVMQHFLISGGISTDAAPARLSSEQVRLAHKYTHNGRVYVAFEGHIYDADGKRIE